MSGTSRVSAEVASVQRWGLEVLRRPYVPVRPPGTPAPCVRPNERTRPVWHLLHPRAEGPGDELALSRQHRALGLPSPGGTPSRDAPGPCVEAPMPPCLPPTGWPLPLWIADPGFLPSPRLCWGSPQPQPAVKPSSGLRIRPARARVLHCPARSALPLGSWLRPLTLPQSSSLPGPGPPLLPSVRRVPLDSQAFLAGRAARPPPGTMLMLPVSVPVGGAGVGGLGAQELGAIPGLLPGVDPLTQTGSAHSSCPVEIAPGSVLPPGRVDAEVGVSTSNGAQGGAEPSSARSRGGDLGLHHHTPARSLDFEPPPPPPWNVTCS